MKSPVGFLRPLVTFVGIVAIWWAASVLGKVPSYMLPTPPEVLQALFAQRSQLFGSTLTTLAEIVLGMVFGTLFGVLCALLMAQFRIAQQWLTPLLILSQAIPVFAFAPLLVLWFGFGMASKVIVTVLIIFFPVATSFYDGLRRTEPGWLELARTMNASPLAVLWRTKVPAALPSFASGLRVSAAISPIGAILGEWVGSAAGLGHVMQVSNARLDTATMFAAVFVLSVVAILLWFVTDRSMRRLLYWTPEASHS